MNQSPRCGARTRQGSPCQSPAVKAGSGAQAGNWNALKHGRYTRELIAFRRMVRELLRESAEKLELIPIPLSRDRCEPLERAK
jgi:hypothetical protein